jgi:hypothetical protein
VWPSGKQHCGTRTPRSVYIWYLGASVFCSLYICLQLIVYAGLGQTVFLYTYPSPSPLRLIQIGTGVGLFSHWKSSSSYAEMCAEHYPRLLAHALWTSRQIIVPRFEANSTQETTNPTMQQWMREGGMGRYTWCVLAAKDCQAEILEVERNRRQAIVDQLSKETDEVDK